MTPNEQVPLRLDPFGITERARSAYGSDGRLALPHTAHRPIFPFETDNLQMRQLADPVVPEPPRHGANADDCSTCGRRTITSCGVTSGGG